ncbi:MAG: hypothetical protein ACJ72N_07050 [Labedaea sp.]
MAGDQSVRVNLDARAMERVIAATVRSALRTELRGWRAGIAGDLGGVGVDRDDLLCQIDARLAELGTDGPGQVCGERHPRFVVVCDRPSHAGVHYSSLFGIYWQDDVHPDGPFSITTPWGMTVALSLDDDRWPWLQIRDEGDGSIVFVRLPTAKLRALGEHAFRLADHADELAEIQRDVVAERTADAADRGPE